MNGLRVAYSGVKGAFAYIAAKKMFPNATYVSYVSINDAYKACEKGECDVCVLPLENSYAGEVGLVMDLMFSGSLYVNQVYELEVTHNLVTKKGAKLDEIRTVYSHKQALDQCADYINKYKFEVIEAPNTAWAAKYFLLARAFARSFVESTVSQTNIDMVLFAIFFKYKY